MRGRDAFAEYHPVVNFTYFAMVLSFSMCLMHPFCLAVSLLCGLGYAIFLHGKRQVKWSLCYLLPVAVATAVINAAFNHQGVTILGYLPSDNPLTMESIVYGVAAATMLASMMTWFSCYSGVVTSDRFIYLFGKLIPALSLVLSMTLRFVPKFKGQLQMVREGQRAMGRNPAQGNGLHRLKAEVTVLSILVTWSLENAIETADSMKSRGYGLSGRTAFSIYTFSHRDRMAMVWLGCCGGYVICGWLLGGLEIQYYPMVVGQPITPVTLSFFLAHLALCLTPMILNKKEERVWNKILQGE